MNEKEKLYEEFKLTRSYGTLKSNFDCLPDDVFNKYLKNPLRENISKKFKQDLLIHKSENKLYKTIYLDEQKDTIFRYHDGTYNVVPDIGKNYSMWVTSKNFKELFYYSVIMLVHESNTLIDITKDTYAVVALNAITTEQLPIKLLFLKAKCSSENTEGYKKFCITTPSSDYWIALNHAVNHYLFSYNHEFLALGTVGQDTNFLLFNLKLQKWQSCSLNGPITALCTAHHSPLFLVGSQNGNIRLILTNNKSFSLNANNNNAKMIKHVQFSPDDTRCFACTNNTFTFFKINEIACPNKKSIINYDFEFSRYPSSVQNASFSPDGRIITVALADGNLIFIDGLTGKHSKQYYAEWHSSDNSKNEIPLFLWGSKNNLLFSLNPTDDTDNTLSTLIIKKLSKGRELASYSCNKSNSIGLTQDENNIVFIHEDNSISLLTIYDDQDLKNINFIEEKANIYQLCQLYQLYKNSKNDPQIYKKRNANATEFISSITTLLSKMQNYKI